MAINEYGQGGGGGGATTLTGLTDTPANYSGDGGKVVKVKADESGLEFTAAGSGSGDVVGPGSATDDNLVTFNTTTGKLIQDSGTAISGLATASHNHSGAEVTSGIVALARGGTGAGTQQAALDAITGTGTNTHILTLTGGNAGWAAASGGGGGWTDDGTTVRLDTATDKVSLGAASGDANAQLSLTGAQAFKAMSTTPTDTAGFGHFFAKDVSPGALLLHMDGTDGAEATTLTDAGSGGHTVTTPGTYNKPYYDTTNKKFTSALRFDTSTAGTNNGGDFVKVEPSEFNFTGAFTVDFWLRLAGTTPNSAGPDGSGLNCLVSVMDPTSSYSNTSNNLVLQYWRDSSSNDNHTLTFSMPNTGGYYSKYNFPSAVTQTNFESGFHHFVLVRSSLTAGDWRVYIDGYHMSYKSGTSPSGYATTALAPNSNYETILGRRANQDGNNGDNDQTGTRDFNGWIEEFRMIEVEDSNFTGTSTSSQNFTPPTAPYEPITHIYARNSLGGEVKIV